MCLPSSVKNAFVMGIVLAGTNLINCIGSTPGDIAAGIVGALISGILISGAHTQNAEMILAWMILAYIDLGSNIFVTVAYVYFFGGAVGGFLITVLVLDVLFSTYAIILAKDARTEIAEGVYEQLRGSNQA